MSPKKSPTVKCCIECGKPLPEGRKRSMRFCEAIPGSNVIKSSACKSSYNNRQKVRGDKIYPLVMAWRFDRENFNKGDGLKVMSRLVSHWHDEDVREGRVSFKPFNQVVQDLYDNGDLQRGDIVMRNQVWPTNR